MPLSASWVQEPYVEMAAAPRQRQLPPPQTQSFQDRLAPQSAARQPAMQPAQPPARRQPAPQQQGSQRSRAESRDARSRHFEEAPPPPQRPPQVRPNSLLAV